MKTKWENIPLAHKIVTIFSVVVSLAVVVSALLQIFDIWSKAINVCVPLLGVEMLCQAYIQWNTSRKVAYFSMGVAAFVLVCSIVVFCIK